jgi:glycosyltransferase involved in cell wall biosynthesis
LAKLPQAITSPGSLLRILIFSQHFTPEVTAAQARVHPIARLLADRGHDVHVITAVPNHPEGIVHEGFRRRAVVHKELDGFRVSYVWARPSPNKTMASRLLLYGSYALSASLQGFVAGRPDVVLVSSPPLPAAAAAAAVAARHRAPLVLDIRDPWPEVAVALGELTNPKLIGLAERLERGLYARASAIVTVTEPFRQHIAALIDDPEKISVIPNGTTKLWLDVGKSEVDRAGLGIPNDRFVWTYAGNVGLAQGLDAALEAAERLGDGFQLRIVGEGPVLARLRERAAQLPNGQVEFTGLVQPELAAQYMRASDALLVPLGAHPTLAKFVPSKLFDACAVGRPVILAAEGESRRLAAAAGAVLAVPPEEPTALAGALRRLREEPEFRQRLAEAGRQFAAGYLRERQVARLEQVLRSVSSD